MERVQWRRLVPAFVLCVATACGSDQPDSAGDPNQDREEIHAATGHEPAPADCADLSGGRNAELAQRRMAFEPDCLIVSVDQTISVTNHDGVPHTLTVVDPPGGPNPRHVRIDVEAEGGERVEVGRVGASMNAGSYPFYCRFHQAEGMTGTLIIRS